MNSLGINWSIFSIGVLSNNRASMFLKMYDEIVQASFDWFRPLNLFDGNIFFALQSAFMNDLQSIAFKKKDKIIFDAYVFEDSLCCASKRNYRLVFF